MPSRRTRQPARLNTSGHRGERDCHVKALQRHWALVAVFIGAITGSTTMTVVRSFERSQAMHLPPWAMGGVDLWPIGAGLGIYLASAGVTWLLLVALPKRRDRH